MWVRRDHRPVEQAAEVARGPVLGDRQDPILNGFTQRRVERSCPFGDQPGPTAIDPTVGQGIRRRRQAVAEILCLADP